MNTTSTNDTIANGETTLSATADTVAAAAAAAASSSAEAVNGDGNNVRQYQHYVCTLYVCTLSNSNRAIYFAINRVYVCNAPFDLYLPGIAFASVCNILSTESAADT
jgi:hypothetical protein